MGFSVGLDVGDGVGDLVGEDVEPDKVTSSTQHIAVPSVSNLMANVGLLFAPDGKL